MCKVNFEGCLEKCNAISGGVCCLFLFPIKGENDVLRRMFEILFRYIFSVYMSTVQTPPNQLENLAELSRQTTISVPHRFIAIHPLSVFVKFIVGGENERQWAQPMHKHTLQASALDIEFVWPFFFLLYCVVSWRDCETCRIDGFEMMQSELSPFYASLNRIKQLFINKIIDWRNDFVDQLELPCWRFCGRPVPDEEVL